jgi:hypothetical protein
MTRTNRASLEVFLAFGNASIAVCQVNELARRVETDTRAKRTPRRDQGSRTPPGALHRRAR